MKALLMVALLITGSVFAKDVNLTGKKISWLGEKVVGDDHKGTITVKKGIITLDDKKVIKTGTVTVDMNSIDNKDLKGEWKTKLEGHLKNKDFFDVEKFPEATLVIKKVKAMKDHKVEVTGDLTIKKISSLNEILNFAKIL